MMDIRVRDLLRLSEERTTSQGIYIHRLFLNPMRGTARLLFLVLIAVMVGANIPITTPASEPALDLGTEEGTVTFVVGEDGEGSGQERTRSITSSS